MLKKKQNGLKKNPVNKEKKSPNVGEVTFGECSLSDIHFYIASDVSDPQRLKHGIIRTKF